VVLGAVGLAAAAVEAWRGLPAGARRRLFAGGIAAGILWTAGAAARVWPHGLCYANELWGGTERAYRWISDADYDWGQGPPGLARLAGPPGHGATGGRVLRPRPDSREGTAAAPAAARAAPQAAGGRPCEGARSVPRGQHDPPSRLSDGARRTPAGEGT